VSVTPREAERGVTHQGRYAGPVSRLLAYLLDVFLISLVFTIALALISAAIDVATPWTVDISKEGILFTAIYLGWAWFYFANGWILRAKTPGMTFLGIRIVRADGRDLDRKHALRRVLAFPLGFLTLGIGFLGIIVGRTRQAIYDRIADTAVIYSWDAQSARLRAIARERAPDVAPGEPPRDAPSHAGA
jgi:uncharacterized RDD family membrane protein YckC